MGILSARELRIGNYVFGLYYSYDDIDEDERTELCMVVGLDVVGFSEHQIWVEGLENSEREVYSDFEPIPLNEEWLLKFGFSGWDKGNYTMILSNGNFMEFEYVIAKNIKYVHQLQNLYFALTNEELTIKQR